MKILACFYFIASILDQLEHEFAIHSLNEGNITCVSDKYVVVEDTEGALFMLCISFCDFLYTFVIIVVFYEVPRVYGLFRRNNHKSSLLNIDNNLGVSQAIKDGQMKSFLTAFKEEDEFLSQTQTPNPLIIRKSSVSDVIRKSSLDSSDV